uniref:Uncharacterized protein n=1 Tax=Rhizophora mucronata TaxID=61149 RepID=A0A2P2MLM0_RHIMU
MQTHPLHFPRKTIRIEAIMPTTKNSNTRNS